MHFCLLPPPSRLKSPVTAKSKAELKLIGKNGRKLRYAAVSLTYTIFSIVALWIMTGFGVCPHYCTARQ